MKKILCFPIFTLLLAPSVCMSDDTVITDNFVIVDKVTESNISLNSNDNSELIGNLVDYSVIVGKRSEDTVAFVISEKGNNYVIGSTIIVECINNENCIPSEINATSLDSGFYKIKTLNYDDWKNTINILDNAHGVKEVYPSYNYGSKIKVQ